MTGKCMSQDISIARAQREKGYCIVNTITSVLLFYTL